MLILGPRKVVDSVHVSPVNAFGKVSVGSSLPCVRSGLGGGVGEIHLRDTAALGVVGEESLSSNSTGGRIEFSLRERVDSLVVLRVILLILSSLMPHLLSPGILRHGPRAVRLDGDVVFTTADAEETLFAPMGSPGVSNVPELLAVLIDTETDNRDDMSDIQVTSLVTVDTTGVTMEIGRGGDVTGDGTSLVDFLNHSLLTADEVELLNTEHAVLVGDETGLARVTVAANVHSAALLTVVVTTSLVD